MSVEGTDCAINETVPFTPMWFSNKFHGPAVWYEIGVSNGTVRIECANGPFLAGKFPYLKVFEKDLLQKLRDGETVIADNG